jgi:hypothetical protein
MRRRIRPGDTTDHELIQRFTEACDDTFTASFFDDPFFDSQDDAREAWPRCRRAVWALTFRMRVPDAARIFDGVTLDSAAAIRSAFSHSTFPLADVLRTLARDRAALADFCRREPKAGIDDYLDIFRADLNLIEQQAREMAQARTERRYPPHSWPAGEYRGGPSSSGEAA